jgi:hypothetical protein
VVDVFRDGQPAPMHGPYHRWTRKKNGRTATRILTDDQLADYQPWFDNHKRLRELIAPRAGWPDGPPSVEIEKCEYVDDGLRPGTVLSSARMYLPRTTSRWARPPGPASDPADGGLRPRDPASRYRQAASRTRARSFRHGATAHTSSVTCSGILKINDQKSVRYQRKHGKLHFSWTGCREGASRWLF